MSDTYIVVGIKQFTPVHACHYVFFSAHSPYTLARHACKICVWSSMWNRDPFLIVLFLDNYTQAPHFSFNLDVIIKKGEVG